MTHANLSLKDLRPGFQFSDPPAPPAIGPDAQLFQHYADMLAAERGPLDRDEELTRLRRAERDGRAHDRKRLLAIETANAKDHRARDRAMHKFLATPACTAQGVLLKIAFGLSSEFLPDDGVVFEGVQSLYSAMIDLNRMVSGAEPVAAVAARARDRRSGAAHQAAA